MLYFNILFSLIPQLSVMREKETARERIAARHKGARNDNQGYAGFSCTEIREEREKRAGLLPRSDFFPHHGKLGDKRK